MVNPCSILTLRPMSPSQSHILQNVGMGSFPVLGSFCENSHLSKDGAFVLGLRLCCFLVDSFDLGVKSGQGVNEWMGFWRRITHSIRNSSFWLPLLSDSQCDLDKFSL